MRNRKVKVFCLIFSIFQRGIKKMPWDREKWKGFFLFLFFWRITLSCYVVHPIQNAIGSTIGKWFPATIIIKKRKRKTGIFPHFSLNEDIGSRQREKGETFFHVRWRCVSSSRLKCPIWTAFRLSLIFVVLFPFNRKMLSIFECFCP